ncbi:MAG TPA: helix-turn-helix domain-containing protein [Nitrospiraceae bacterium]|jgi:hypothetical protein|nr:helix-turn-helix domain-containing protein [Nitrospiraceae bacterium]
MGSEPREIIDRLLQALNLKTQAQLAVNLEIRPQSIVSAIHRGEIPEGWLYRVAYLTGRNVDWLRTGKGPTWHAEVAAETSPTRYGTGRVPDAAVRRLVAVWEELDAEEQTALERCAEILRVGDRDVREHLIGQLKLMEEAVQLRRRKRARLRRRSP